MLAVVVYGASGDLARRKTFPALYALYLQGHLPRRFVIVGFARTHLAPGDLAARLAPGLAAVEARLSSGGPAERTSFLERVRYVASAYDDEAGYVELGRVIAREESLSAAPNAVSNSVPNAASNSVINAASNSPCAEDRLANVRLHYLALPPDVFAVVAAAARRVLGGDGGVHRVVVEKPFGRDTPSSDALTAALHAAWPEDALFRIDHYLGKEMVKAVATLRLANHVFAALWSAEHIACVQVVVKEAIGVEGRGAYFDAYGIVRDVMQNHMLQMLSLVAMEPPAAGTAAAVRDAKVAALRAVPALRRADLVLGQYGSDGARPAYAAEDSVPPGSRTATYALATLAVDTPRWRGVPFVLRAGKGLDEQKTEIRVQFRRVPGADALFGAPADAPDGCGLAPNELVVRVQPAEAVYLKFNVRRPGHGAYVSACAPESAATLGDASTPPSSPVSSVSTASARNTECLPAPMLADLDLSYSRRYASLRIPDAYEALLLDALRGDHANFVRADELAEAWRIFTPVLHAIDAENAAFSRPGGASRAPSDGAASADTALHVYPRGSRGPPAADERLIAAGYVPRPAGCSYAWPVQSL